jgi:hypothetical protein
MAYAALVNVAAGECTMGLKYVNPGSVSLSYLMDKLQGTNLCSGSQMPLGAPPLSAANIATIASWICQGALNN